MIVVLLVLILLSLLFPGFMRGVAICLLLIVVFAFARVGHAQADEMPVVDVDKVCAERGSMVLINQCIDMEQAAYDQLLVLWPALDEERQRDSITYFNETAGRQPFPFTYLRGFVAEQLNRQQVDEFLHPKERRQFRY